MSKNALDSGECQPRWFCSPRSVIFWKPFIPSGLLRADQIAMVHLQTSVPSRLAAVRNVHQHAVRPALIFFLRQPAFLKENFV